MDFAAALACESGPSAFLARFKLRPIIDFVSSCGVIFVLLSCSRMGKMSASVLLVAAEKDGRERRKVRGR